jgi:hypothetical protein
MSGRGTRTLDESRVVIRFTSFFLLLANLSREQSRRKEEHRENEQL